MVRRLTACCVFTLIVAARVASAQTPPELIAYPSLVLYNGKILTVDAQFSVAEAVAVRDGRILAVGTNDQVKRLIGPSTRAIDLQGKTVVPGFIDSDGDNAFAGGDLYKDTMVNGKVGSKVRGDSVAELLKQVSALVKEAAGPGMVLRDVATVAAIGVGTGVAAALAFSRVMTSVLYGIGVYDAVTFITVPVVIAVVALAAGAVPAIRAARVDPLVAMRDS